MVRHRGVGVLLSTAVLCFVAGGPAEASRLQVVKDPSELLIVDCLLPGQVRQLGGRMTYLTPRRPTKTSASDCQIRGGEYVAFDRANYATALQVWLPIAREGDPQAQTFVGEIYEKGLGRPADHAAAAEWYQKAADQGFSRAQSNLAYLYEQGLGVPKDPVKALNLYRLSAGLPDDEALVFESELTAVRIEVQSQIETLSQALQQQVEEANSLRVQRDEARLLAASRRATLEHSRSEVTALQAQVTELKNVIGPSPDQLDQLRRRESALAEQETQIARQAAELAQAEQMLRVQESALDSRVAETQDQAAALRAQLGDEQFQAKSMAARLAAAEERVRASEARIAELETDLDRQRRFIDSERGRLGEVVAGTSQAAQAERAQLEAELQDRESYVNQQQALIRELQTQNQAYASDVARLQAEKAASEGAVQVQATETATVRAQLASTEQQLLVTQQKLAQASTELEQERRRIAAERQTLENSRAAGDAQRQSEIQRLNRELARLESESIEQKARIVELSTERSEFSRLLASAEIGGTPPTFRASGVGLIVPGERSQLFQQLGVGSYHALIIGNNVYANMPSLDSAITDAQAIDQLLRERYGFQTRLLLNATRAEILSALNDYRLNLRETDNFLIYYAGHGELDNRNLTGYWLPVNARRDDTTEWISDRMITEQVNLMAARHVMIVADSCYSGAMTRSSGARLHSRASDAELRRLTMLAKLKSRTVLTSGGEAPVLDGGGGRHSIFARAFLEILENNDGVLEGSALYNLIFDPVKQGAARFKVDQSPRYSVLADAGHGQGEFLFIFPG